MTLNTTGFAAQNELVTSKISWAKFSRLIFPLVTILTGFTSATTAAGYDIWVYSLEFNQNSSSWTLGEGHSVSNREGYDNQPAFTLDSHCLGQIASQR